MEVGRVMEVGTQWRWEGGGGEDRHGDGGVS